MGFFSSFGLLRSIGGSIGGSIASALARHGSSLREGVTEISQVKLEFRNTDRITFRFKAMDNQILWISRECPRRPDIKNVLEDIMTRNTEQEIDRL